MADSQALCEQCKRQFREMDTWAQMGQATPQYRRAFNRWWDDAQAHARLGHHPNPEHPRTLPYGRLVHNHGTEDGPGLACREHTAADGFPLGECMVPKSDDLSTGGSDA